MARPTLLNDDLKDRLEVAAEAVYHYKYVAGLCGIHRTTLDEWVNKDEDLATRLEQARSRFIKNHMRKAKPDFMLQTADRETFGQKLEVTGGDNPIRILLQAYGIDPLALKEGDPDVRKNDGAISAPPTDKA